MMPDVTIHDGGSVVLLTPETDEAREWFDEHVGVDNGYQPYWPTVVVEARYVGDVIAGLVNDGMEVTT